METTNVSTLPIYHIDSSAVERMHSSAAVTFISSFVFVTS